MRKKWLALLLSLCMVLSLFPAAVFAAEGDGTAASPYLVSNEEELRQAVEQGGYIQLTDNIVISQAIEIKKDLVIDGKNPDSGSANGENCYTVSTNVADRVFNVNQAKDLSLVFQNLQILSESEKAYTRGISLYQSENIQVELENVKLTAGYYALNIASENKGITAELDHSLLEGWCAFQLWSPSKVSVKNSILNGNNNKSYNQDGWNDFSTIVINQDATESEVTVENSTITASTGTGNCQQIVSIQNVLNTGDQDAPVGNVIRFDGCTFQAEGDRKIEKDGKFVTTPLQPLYNSEGGNTILLDGKSLFIPTLPEESVYKMPMGLVARIGEFYFGSLAAAVSYAKDGDTVTLVQNAEGGGVVFEENGRTLTIDFNGFTYTVTDPTVGSAGTETNGFQLLKGNAVTLKNGTLKAGSSAQILLQNYCDLTLEDITVDCRESSQCDYALSNNFGNITLKGNTNLYAAEGKNAFDLWYGMFPVYYDGVSVTVDKSMTGTIQGKIKYGSNVPEKEGWQEKTKLEIRGGHFDGDFAASSTGALEGANIAIYGGYFTSDPSDYAAEGYVAIASDEAGYSYMVTEKAYTGDIEVRPDVSDNDVRKEQIPDDITEAEKEALLSAAGSVEVPDLAAQSGAIANDITEEEANQAADALREETGKETKDEDITIYVQTFLDVQPKDYNAAESTLVLDVTPRYQVVASTADTAGQIQLDGKDKNAVVQESGELEIVSPVELSLQLPVGFSNNPKLYITHTKESGKQYVYTGALEGNTLTFTNPHGFSEFSVGEENPAAAEIGDIGYLSLQDAVDEVANNDTIVLLKEGQEATVSQIVRFTLSSVGGYTAEIQPGPRYSMSYDEDTGTYAFTRRHVTNSDGESIGWELPLRGETSPAFESDTTYDLTVNDVYQFRITSLDGHTPAMTLGNGNFRVELASRSGNDYFFKVYVQGNAGSTCGVFVDGQYLLTLTVGGSAVVSDTTAPFTVAQGGTYQFKLTAAQRPAFAAGSPCFTVEYAGNSGNDWFYKVHAVGEAGESSGFYINGSASPVAVASIG